MARVLWGVLACALSLSVTQPVFAASQLSDAWDRVKAFTVEKKDDAVTFGRQLVRDTDAKITELEDKAAQASGDTKAAYERSIVDLKKKRDAASVKLDEMGKATGAAWDATKQGFADAYKDVQDSYDKAVGNTAKEPATK